MPIPPIPNISPFPPAPNRADGAETFSPDGDAYLLHMEEVFAPEMIAVVSAMNTALAGVDESVEAAAGSANAAAGSANAAAASANAAGGSAAAAGQFALDAAASAALNGTSTTNRTPALGAMTFDYEVPAGKTPPVGARVRVASRANPITNFAVGTVTGYAAPTISVNVDSAGTAPLAAVDWNIVFGEGSRGEQGGAAFSGRVAVVADRAVTAADLGAVLDVTATATLTFAAPALLGDDFTCEVGAVGAANVTIPASDGVFNWIMYPGERRRFYCDGATLRSSILHPFSLTLTTTATFKKPPGYQDFAGLLWGGGGSGSKSSSYGTGGGGGACVPFRLSALALAASETVTIAAGGTGPSAASGVGTVGGNSTFGALVTAYGGAGGNTGTDALGGGGGGPFAAGVVGTGGGHQGSTVDDVYAGGNSALSSRGGNTIYGGAGGGTDTTVGGKSLYGGGGGGGAAGGVAGGGTSTFGGAGGAGASAASGTDGVAPGGAGGGTRTGAKAGNGARGECRIWGIA